MKKIYVKRRIYFTLVLLYIKCSDGMSPVAVCTLVRLSVSRSVQSRSHILRLTHHGVASTLTSENLKWRTAAILKIEKSHLCCRCHIKFSHE